MKMMKGPGCVGGAPSARIEKAAGGGSGVVPGSLVRLFKVRDCGAIRRLKTLGGCHICRDGMLIDG